MLVSGMAYQVEHKRAFHQAGAFKPQSLAQVFEFAHAMSFGTGEHRNHRSGGQLQRNATQIFKDTLQGKLAEMAVYNVIYKQNKAFYACLSQPDFDVYGLGEWDTADIICTLPNKWHENNTYQQAIQHPIQDVPRQIKFSIKSTKHFGQLLLLETKDWNADGAYIPNLKDAEKQPESMQDGAIYDYVVLVRLKEDDSQLTQEEKAWLADLKIADFVTEKHNIKQLFLKKQWYYDAPVYISHAELKDIIKRRQIIPKNALLNGKMAMDASNYYAEVGSMQDFASLIRAF